MTKPNAHRRVYQAPRLIKGPKLTDIAAVVAKSPGQQPCWVARAAFGEQDFRWQIFRAWLMDDAPAWFRSLYIRHGAGVGSWLQDRETAKRLVRSAMMVIVRRKLAR
jgi:hypothetical protein